MKRLLTVSFLLLCFQMPCYAISGFSIASGTGEPNSLRGGRASLIWDWHRYWLKTNPVVLTGFWDVSVAYWTTNGNVNGDYKSLGAFAASPIFRIIPNPKYTWPITPYLEAGLGVALLTNDNLGKRDLGSHFAFQDLVGFGFAFGKNREFSLSYHYLHYSNANIWPPNAGIDVKYLFQFMTVFN